MGVILALIMHLHLSRKTPGLHTTTEVPRRDPWGRAAGGSGAPGPERRDAPGGLGPIAFPSPGREPKDGFPFPGTATASQAL